MQLVHVPDLHIIHGAEALTCLGRRGGGIRDGMRGRSGGVRRGPPPTLSSINYSQVDTLGAGADIVLTGTNLTGATAVEFRANGSGGAWTAAASLGTNTAMTQAVQAPPLAAGLYDARITTPGGQTTLLNAVEAWAPTTDPTCTYLLERPSYAFDVPSSVGTWTRRFGPSDATNNPGPPAVGGAPNWDGTGQLSGPTLLTTLHPNNALTHFAVTSFTNTDAMVTTGAGGSGPAANPHLTECANQGSIGICAGRVATVPGFLFHITASGVNYCPFVPATENVQHAVLARFNSASNLAEINVDGGAFAQVTSSGTWNFTTGALKLGANYDNARKIRGTTKVIGILNATASATFAAKFFKWSQQRHGVV